MITGGARRLHCEWKLITESNYRVIQVRLPHPLLHAWGGGELRRHPGQRGALAVHALCPPSRALLRTVTIAPGRVTPPRVPLPSPGRRLWAHTAGHASRATPGLPRGAVPQALRCSHVTHILWCVSSVTRVWRPPVRTGRGGGGLGASSGRPLRGVVADTGARRAGAEARLCAPRTPALTR